MTAFLIPVFLKIPTENIVVLKCYLEGHEFLGEMRTLDAEAGEVVILALDDALSSLEAFLGSVTVELSIERIEAPKSAANDWLLSEGYWPLGISR